MLVAIVNKQGNQYYWVIEERVSINNKHESIEFCKSSRLFNSIEESQKDVNDMLSRIGGPVKNWSKD